MKSENNSGSPAVLGMGPAIRKLIEEYALRARLHYEAVSGLGMRSQIDPEFHRLLKRIIKLQEDCFRCGTDLRSNVFGQEESRRRRTGNHPKVAWTGGQ